MANNELMRKTATASVAIALGVFAYDKVRDIFPDFDFDSEPRIGSIETENKISSVRNIDDRMLTESDGETKAELEGELKCDGFIAVCAVRNAVGEVAGDNLSTSVTTYGKLQLGVHAKGLEISPPSNNGTTEVTVDTTKLFTQQVKLYSLPDETETNDGFFVNLRRLFHEDEARVDDRADALTNLSEISHDYKCTLIMKTAFPGSVVKWAMSQRPDITDPSEIRLLDQNGELLDMNKVDLSTPELEQAMDDAISAIEGEEDGVKIQVEKIELEDCDAEAKAIDEINAINEGVVTPTPEVLDL